MKKPGVGRIIVDYVAITAGALAVALGIGAFLIDAQVVPGGVSGLSMAIHYLTGGKVPVGLLMWGMNVPLYIWGVKELGRSFGARTFYGFTTSSVFIDLFRGSVPGLGFIRIQDSASIRFLVQQDFFFMVLLGAALVGVGLGVIFKFKGTTGGSDIVAAVAQKRWGTSPGKTFLVTDFFVISLAGVIIQVRHLSPDKPAFALTLYAFLLLFVSSRLVDIVIEGFDYAKSAWIISDRNREIGERVMHELSRGATAFHGKGLYSGVERDILYTVINRSEVHVLRELVRGVDPDAFVIISNVHEVLGEGFRRRVDVELPVFLKKKE